MRRGEQTIAAGMSIQFRIIAGSLMRSRGSRYGHVKRQCVLGHLNNKMHHDCSILHKNIFRVSCFVYCSNAQVIVNVESVDLENALN